MLGAVLVALAIVGWLTVADDFRHTGEFLGVTYVALAGAFLLVAGFRTTPRTVPAFRALAAGSLCAIPIGGALDNMPAGLAIGLAGATLVWAIIARRHRRSGMR